MRKFKLLISILIIFIVTSVSVSALTEQLSDSGTIILKGSVAKRVSISVTPIGDYSNLDLLADVADLAVASVNERSNVHAGYTVKLQSENAIDGNPKFAGGAGDDVLLYTIKYGGSDVVFSGNEAVITDSAAKTGVSGIDKELAISYAGTAVNIYEGEYTDTLLFTIEAK